MTRDEEFAATGGLSKTTKMPGASYGLSAFACQTGSKLCAIPGTICEGCYARKGRYRLFKGIVDAHARRLESLRHPDWETAMSAMLSRLRVPWFRWHDSGDLQGTWHLRRIVNVCEATPKVKHWLPTTERKMLLEYLEAGGCFPPNLCIRLSAVFPDMEPDLTPALRAAGVRGSTVFTCTAQEVGDNGWTACGASRDDYRCGACRRCWNRRVPVVGYAKH